MRDGWVHGKFTYLQQPRQLRVSVRYVAVTLHQRLDHVAEGGQGAVDRFGLLQRPVACLSNRKCKLHSDNTINKHFRNVLIIMEFSCIFLN